MKTVLKQTVHRADIYFDVYESTSHKDSKKTGSGLWPIRTSVFHWIKTKDAKWFDKLLKLSSFKKELLRFFFEEIEHLEYALTIGEKVL